MTTPSTIPTPLVDACLSKSITDGWSDTDGDRLCDLALLLERRLSIALAALEVIKHGTYLSQNIAAHALSQVESLTP